MTMNDPPAGGNDYSSSLCPKPFALCLLKTKDNRKKIKDGIRGFKNIKM